MPKEPGSKLPGIYTVESKNLILNFEAATNLSLEERVVRDRAELTKTVQELLTEVCGSHKYRFRIVVGKDGILNRVIIKDQLPGGLEQFQSGRMYARIETYLQDKASGSG